MDPAPEPINERTFRFAARIVRLVGSLPRDQAGVVVARQLARCGTGIGANVEEAQGAHSRRDYARRMNVARTEAREALYWLRLIAETELVPESRMRGVIQEADEILRILVSIVKKLKEVKQGEANRTGDTAR